MDPPRAEFNAAAIDRFGLSGISDLATIKSACLLRSIGPARSPRTGYWGCRIYSETVAGSPI
jgi:hypothetical protein